MKKEPSTLQAVSFAMGIGISSAIIVGCGIFFGRWADQNFLIAPWGTVTGILTGFAAAIWSIYKRLVGKNRSGF